MKEKLEKIGRVKFFGLACLVMWISIACNASVGGRDFTFYGDPRWGNTSWDVRGKNGEYWKVKKKTSGENWEYSIEVSDGNYFLRSYKIVGTPSGRPGIDFVAGEVHNPNGKVSKFQGFPREVAREIFPDSQIKTPYERLHRK